MGTLRQDTRYGIRMLAKSPGFTTIALITLAVGIGANTMMFSVADTLLLLRPGKVKNPEQLAYCTLQDARFCWFRHSEYVTIRDSGLAFSDVMAQVSPYPATLAHGGMARRAWATYTSANYFSVLGVAPTLGRLFVPEEEQPGCVPVVVLSHRCWQRLGGDPKLIGESLCIDGVDCQVVGVAPPCFGGVTFDGCDFWLPLGSIGTVLKHSRARPDWKPWLDVVGRLKPGLDMAVAQAQLQTLFPQLKPECLERNWGGRPAFELRPPGRFSLGGDNAQDRWAHILFSLVLMTASAIVLLVACLNLANMLIVRGASRHREIAVRMAVGGGRWRIVRQLLIESGLLAIVGGGLGVLLACGGTRMLNLWLAAIPIGETGPRFGLNIRVLAATVGLCLAATLLFGLRPALLLSNRDIAGEMKAVAGRVLGGGTKRRGNLSVAGQTALAVTLVFSATLLTRSALRMARMDPRFPLNDKLVVEIDPEAAGYDRGRSIQACEALADSLTSLREVKAAGRSTRIFFGGGGPFSIGECLPQDGESRSGRPPSREAAQVTVGHDYFEAMGIPLLRGRLFNRLDGIAGAEKVAIVDESLSRRLRPDGNSLGCLIRWSFYDEHSDPYRVVGIVAHLPGIEGREIRAQMFTPAGADDLTPCFYLHVQSKGACEVLRRRIAEEIHRADPHIPILSVTTLAQKRSEDSSVWLARFGARLAMAAGAAALFLAALGIYATKGYIVASRTSEIGVRKALGATHGSILGMVLRDGLGVTMAGLIIGLAMGLPAARVAAGFLYGISPIDPVSIAVTVALLGAAALLAGYLPARRAARIDPMAALRCE